MRQALERASRASKHLYLHIARLLHRSKGHGGYAIEQAFPYGNAPQAAPDAGQSIWEAVTGP